MNTTAPSSIKTSAIELITEQLGSVVSDGYVEFYKNKTDDEILISVTELMEEMLGQQKARKELEKHRLVKTG